MHHINDKAQHDKVKVDPSMAFWNLTQGQWNGPDNEKPNFSPDLSNGQHEGPAREIRGFMRRRKIKHEMLTPWKRAPHFLISFYELEPAQHSDRHIIGVRAASASACCEEGV